MALLAAFFMSVSPALAQQPCAPRDALVANLNDKFGETLRFQGLTHPNRQLVEVLVSKDGETWTILVTLPGGLSCITGSGKDWRDVAPELLKPMGMPT